VTTVKTVVRKIGEGIVIVVLFVPVFVYEVCKGISHGLDEWLKKEELKELIEKASGANGSSEAEQVMALVELKKKFPEHYEMGFSEPIPTTKEIFEIHHFSDDKDQCGEEWS
jgi:hypothetical protein